MNILNHTNIHYLSNKTYLNYINIMCLKNTNKINAII
jgi:hypothetical protein